MATIGTGGNVGGRSASFEAASDLSSYQYRGVQFDSNGRVSYGTGGTLTNTSPVVGILQNKPSGTSHAAEVMLPGGISKIYAEAAITIGTWITFGTAGGGSALPSSGTAQVLGLVTKSADTAGDIGEVLIQPFRYTFGA